MILPSLLKMYYGVDIVWPGSSSFFYYGKTEVIDYQTVLIRPDKCEPVTLPNPIEIDHWKVYDLHWVWKAANVQMH